VIAHGFKWRGNPFEDSLPVVSHFGGLTVHETLGPVHFATEDCAEALMSEADSEHGDFAIEMFDGVGGDAVIFDGLTGSRGDDKMRRIEGDELIYRNLVIAEDTNLRAQFAEVLNEVVGK
jgi:hypothetical protein